jgi:hypothetical protein
MSNTKTCVTFLFPGSFFPEERTSEVASRDEAFVIPDRCFAYYFFDREEGKLSAVGNK